MHLLTSNDVCLFPSQAPSECLSEHEVSTLAARARIHTKPSPTRPTLTGHFVSQLPRLSTLTPTSSPSPLPLTMHISGAAILCRSASLGRQSAPRDHEERCGCHPRSSLRLPALKAASQLYKTMYVPRLHLSTKYIHLLVHVVTGDFFITLLSSFHSLSACSISLSLPSSLL